MKSRYWILGWVVIVILGLGMLGLWVYKIDPYMHYHKPDVSNYYYVLDNQRSQNDGIIKHFDYDALITGTSMADNFKTSEMDDIFGCNSIKVSYTGASYKEINKNLETATKKNSNLKIVVRGLDMAYFIDDKDRMRLDLGDYPLYLYDDILLNDVRYIWNRDVIWNRVYTITEAKKQEGFKSGITSFDDYSCWQYNYTFGIKTVCPAGIEDFIKGEPVHLSDLEKKVIADNIEQNVTNLARENPNITFYCFFPPYSAVWWMDQVKTGTIYKQIEAEEYVINIILECDNIKLFSFNNRLDITGNINNYKDSVHYGQWINDLMLRWMYEGKYELTEDNYKDYLEAELYNYSNFNYTELNNQIDYENDFYIAALLNQEFAGVQSINLLDINEKYINLKNASIVENQYEGSKGIECIGCLQRMPGSEISVIDYVSTVDFVGGIIEIENVNEYGYITFYGKKINESGQPTVYVIDENGEEVGEISCNYNDIDNEWHQYVIDITKARGRLRIIFNGGYIDNTGNPESDYIFSNIILY